MRIGIDIRSLMDRQYSGVNMYAFNLLDALFNIDKNNEYILFYSGFKDLLKDKKFLADWLKNGNITLRGSRVPNKVLNASVAFLNWPKIDRMLVPPPPSDCRSGQDFPPFCGKGKQKVDIFFIPNFLFSSFSDDCKKIITVHDLSFERRPDFFSIKGRLWHKFVRTKKLCGEADLIIAVSENTKRDIMELYGIDEKKIRVVYPGVEISPSFQEVERERFFAGISASESMANPSMDIAAKAPPLPSPERGGSVKYILSLGTIEKRKNTSGVIKAFEIMSEKYGIGDHKLIIAGQKGFGADRVESEIRNLKSEIRKKIEVMGYIDEKDKPELYKNASLFLYPSFYEGFGFPPLEAMGFGVPVITANNSSLPEVVGDAAIMVNPYDAEDIARAMALILSDEELRLSLINRGKERIKKFSRERSAGEMLEIFGSL